MLIFDQNTVHKSVIDENRITIQLRYEEITKNFKKKSVNQIVDSKGKKFLAKKISPKCKIKFLIVVSTQHHHLYIN
jgi:hypothetical protein